MKIKPQKVLVRLDWKSGNNNILDNYDLDIMAFICKGYSDNKPDKSKVNDSDDIIYYHNHKHKSNAIHYLNDDLGYSINEDGIGTDDCGEQIKIELDKISLHNDNIQRIAIAVIIYDAEVREQCFGQIDDACIKLVDINGNDIVLDNGERNNFQCDLTKNFSTENTFVYCEFIRQNDLWEIILKHKGYKGGIKLLSRQYGFGGFRGRVEKNFLDIARYLKVYDIYHCIAGPTLLQELRWKKKIKSKNTEQRLNDNIVLLTEIMRQYIELLNNKWRFIWLNILAGIFRGLGMAIGASIVFTIVLKIFSYLIDMNLPLISEWIAELINMIEINKNDIQ